MSDTVVPFAVMPAAPRAAPGAALPPLSKALATMVGLARLARTHSDRGEALGAIALIARLQLPAASPAAGPALASVRAALVDELVHDLLPNATPEIEALLEGLARHFKSLAPLP